MLDRKTKIVCTIGPKSASRSSVNSLLLAGMNVLRLNCSHGDHDFYRDVIGNLEDCLNKVRHSMMEPGVSIDFSDGAREDVCAVALDTKGPEIRTGVYADETVSGSALREVRVERGSEVTIHVTDDMETSQTSTSIWCDYKNLPKILSKGDIVFIDDGLLSLKVSSTQNDSVTCVAENTSLLGERKGINLPGVSVDLPAVSEKDRKDLEFARKDRRVDFVFASFIREASNVEEIRDLVGPDVRIISKIENAEGVDNIDEIIEASDGIMVARGDLGIEIPPERVFLVQKSIISKCNVAGKPVICATQMLESMTRNPRPTRAECGDVANAVLDGSDAVMLSGETAKGNFPEDAVTIMSKICQAAEASVDYHELYETIHRRTRNANTAEALVSAAVSASIDENACMIVVISETGKTAQLIAKYRPECVILVMTANEKAARAMQLIRNAQVILLPRAREKTTCELEVDPIIKRAFEAGKEMGIAKPGDTAVIVSGTPGKGDFRGPNVMQLVQVPARAS